MLARLSFVLATVSVAFGFGASPAPPSKKTFAWDFSFYGPSGFTECQWTNFSEPAEGAVAPVAGFAATKPFSTSLKVLPVHGSGDFQGANMFHVLAGQVEFDSASGEKRTRGPGEVAVANASVTIRNVGGVPASFTMFAYQAPSPIESCPGIEALPGAPVRMSDPGAPPPVVPTEAEIKYVDLSTAVDWPQGGEPSVDYFHTYSEADGKAYVAKCTFDNFTLSSDGTWAMDNLDLSTNGTAYKMSPLVSVFPEGAFVDWHTSPTGLSFSVVSAGLIEWEYSSGQKFQFGPGDRMIEQDFYATGSIGHTTRNVYPGESRIIVYASDLKAPPAGSRPPCSW